MSSFPHNGGGGWEEYKHGIVEFGNFSKKSLWNLTHGIVLVVKEYLEVEM